MPADAPVISATFPFSEFTIADGNCMGHANSPQLAPRSPRAQGRRRATTEQYAFELKRILPLVLTRVMQMLTPESNVDWVMTGSCHCRNVGQSPRASGMEPTARHRCISNGRVAASMEAEETAKA